jgi:hypothetical protein
MSKAIDFIKKLHETGEMSASELEQGGEWYEFRLELEGICKAAGLKCEVKPFDQYQGPYAYVEGSGKLWGLGDFDEEGEFYFEGPGEGPGEGYSGDKEDMINHLKSLKKGKKSK